MPTAFPALCPSARNYAPGNYPVRRFTSINGAGTTRIYGNKSFDATLSMEFIVTDDQLEDVLECWNAALGQYDTLLLPNQLFGGISAGVQDEIIPEHLKWRWAEKPRVESLLEGRSRVRTQFVANLD